MAEQNVGAPTVARTRYVPNKKFGFLIMLLERKRARGMRGRNVVQYDELTDEFLPRTARRGPEARAPR
jgi:hypothetical protein